MGIFFFIFIRFFSVVSFQGNLLLALPSNMIIFFLIMKDLFQEGVVRKDLFQEGRKAEKLPRWEGTPILSWKGS